MTIRNGKQRVFKSEWFTDFRIIKLDPAVKITLMGLMGFSDDAGNVDLDLKALGQKMHVTVDQDEELLHGWIKVLIKGGFLIPYKVRGKNYASIEGWGDNTSPFYQKIDQKSMASWRNPSREEADDEDEVSTSYRESTEELEDMDLEDLPSLEDDDEDVEQGPPIIANKNRLREAFKTFRNRRDAEYEDQQDEGIRRLERNVSKLRASVHRSEDDLIREAKEWAAKKTPMKRPRKAVEPRTAHHPSPSRGKRLMGSVRASQGRSLK